MWLLPRALAVRHLTQKSKPRNPGFDYSWREFDKENSKELPILR
jgi:hypothetical protein